MNKFDIAILGSGCAGRSLAYASSQRGISTLLIEGSRFTASSSLRNQGWLHSGALYAVANSDGVQQLVSGFAESAKLLREFEDSVSSNFVGNEDALMVFDDSSRLELAISQMTAANLEFETVEANELKNLDPLLKKSSFVGGIKNKCTTVDTPGFLNALRDESSRLGCSFWSSKKEQLSEVSLTRSGSDWIIRDGEFHAIAKNVICAAGVHIPQCVETWLRMELNTITQYGFVVATTDIRSKRLINVIADTPGNSFNLSPFSTGITINNGYDDENELDFELHDKYAKFEDVLEVAGRFLPELSKYENARYQGYVCQKLRFKKEKNRSLRQYQIQKLEDGFYIFYPGKFSLALIASQRLLDTLSVASLVDASFPRFGELPELVHPGIIDP